MKTADEMFRELGYERNECQSTDGRLIFTLKKEIDREYLKITFEDGFVEKELVTKYPSSITWSFDNAEILACAQLIKEMGANHEA